MSDRQINWKGPFLVESENATYSSQLPDSPGIYRIRALTSTQKPASIPRCNGTDPNGILHIGETKYLRTRVRDFRNAAFHSGEAHAAGWEFCDSGFTSQFSKEMIYYDFAERESKEAAEECERALHEEYRKRFHDKPPLDANRGKKERKP